MVALRLAKCVHAIRHCGMHLYHSILEYSPTVSNCRQIYTPDLALDKVPAFVALKSSDNIPIETSWHYMRTYNGKDLKAAILLTKDADKRYFNPMDQLHVYVFLVSEF